MNKVTHDNPQNEIEIRRFLLGEMTGDERASFEERFIGDQDLFESARVVEDELIEAYCRGTLEPETRERFERSFLTTEKRRRRVAFTRGMLAKLPEYKEAEKLFEAEAAKTSWLAPAIAFLKRPSMAFATVVAVMLGVFAGWYLSERSGGSEAEIVREVTPTPVIPSPTPVENVTVPDPSNKETRIPANDSDVNSNKDENKTPNPPKTRGGVVLALYAGTVRSEGKTRSVTFRKDSGDNAVYLMLYLDRYDYEMYQADVVDQNGSVVYHSGTLKRGVSAIRGLSVPALNLPNGDYMVRLSGIKSDGQSESAADYQFRVNRR